MNNNENDKKYEKQNQHYHPNFLLKWFKGKNLLYFDGEKVEHRNSDKIFSENNYFGDKDSFIEKYFADTEMKAANIFRKILTADDKEVFINRGDKNAITLLLSQLPLRAKTYAEQFATKEDYLNHLENTLRNFNTDWRNINYQFPENNFQSLLKFQTTFWKSKIDLPLFSENIGMNETGFESLKRGNGDFCLDCQLNKEPDTIYFPISKDRLIIYLNPKFSFDTMLRRTGFISQYLLNPNSIFENGDFIKKAIDFINENYCERSILVKLQLFNFWFATSAPTFNNKKSVNEIGKVDYTLASDDDEYKFTIKEMDREMYKFFLIENLIKYWFKKEKDEIIIPDTPEFLIVMKEILGDLKDNLNPASMNEYLKNGKIVSPENWYRYAIYKLSTNESIKALSRISFKLITAIEKYNEENK